MAYAFVVCVQRRIVFLMLSRLKIHIILVLDIGLDVVRSMGNLSSNSYTPFNSPALLSRYRAAAVSLRAGRVSGRVCCVPPS